MLAMMRTLPSHSLQVSISIEKTRFNRIAHVMDTLFSAGVWSVSSVEWGLLCLPRLADSQSLDNSGVPIPLEPSFESNRGQGVYPTL